MSLTHLKELTVLGLLRDHPMHGYALVEALEQGIGFTVGLTRPTVYAILRRFDDRGWVVGEVVSDSAYPDREVYRVTDEGQAAYREICARCAADVPEGTYPIATVLAHLGELEPEEQAVSVRRMLEHRRARLDALEGFPEHDGLFGAALQLLIAQLRVEVEMLVDLAEGG
jgi:DNA-binding PadR family transcriptional regulator